MKMRPLFHYFTFEEVVPLNSHGDPTICYHFNSPATGGDPR